MTFSLTTFLHGQTPAKPKSPWLGVWSANLPNHGIIALNVWDQGTGEPKSVQVWWLVEELRLALPMRIENGTLYLDQTAPQNQTRPGCAFRLTEAGTLKLTAYGVFKEPLDPLWENLELRPNKGSNPWYDITNNHYKTSEWGKWHEAGTLKPIPTSWAAEVVLPTAKLLSRDNFILSRFLVLPALPGSFLEEAYDWLPRSVSEGTNDGILEAMAGNPSCPASLLEKIWQNQDNPKLWRIAANNPHARPEWRAGLVDRIMGASDRVKQRATWDGDGPTELYARLLKDSREIRESLARSRKMPAEVYEILAREAPADTIRLLAENEAVPASILETLATAGDRSLKFTLLRNKKLSPETHRKLVHELAQTATTKELGALAPDPDVPPEFLARCMEDLDYSVRSGVANNPSTSQEMLVRLANDYSGWTAAAAREALKRRFPVVLLRITPELVPLNSLDGDVTLNTRFQKAMERSDLKEMTRLADYLEAKGELHGVLSLAAKDVVKTYRPDIMDFFLANNFNKYHVALADLAGECGGDARWLAYFKAHGAFEKNLAGRSFEKALDSGRIENLAGLIAAGLDVNTPASQGTTALHRAVLRRNMPAIDLLLKAGARTDVRDDRRQTPLDYAVMAKLIPAIKLMDKEGRHAVLIEAFTKEFPAAPDSRFLGQWTNGKDGFTTVVVSLEPDGTGRFAASIASRLIAWREASANEAVAYMFDEKGALERNFTLKLRLNAEGTELYFEPEKGEKQKMRRDKR